MLRASALRKFSGRATQKVEQLAKVLPFAGHWSQLGQHLNERDFFHAREELGAMERILEELRRSVRVFPWSLPFALALLEDLVVVEDARISGRPLPRNTAAPADPEVDAVGGEEAKGTTGTDESGAGAGGGEMSGQQQQEQSQADECPEDSARASAPEEKGEAASTQEETVAQSLEEESTQEPAAGVGEQHTGEEGASVATDGHALPRAEGNLDVAPEPTLAQIPDEADAESTRDFEKLDAEGDSPRANLVAEPGATPGGAMAEEEEAAAFEGDDVEMQQPAPVSTGEEEPSLSSSNPPA